MSADRIVKRHKRIGKKFMKELDKLSDKYPPHKREMHGYLAEVYLKEQEDLINRFAQEYNEKDAPMRWVGMEKIYLPLTRAGVVSLVSCTQDEWSSKSRF
tara:strand:+ start:1717 stop:2016 length:300 start_codon:yes stop_codon:yes gene_type:complete